ncbi:MAG TPA: hypothetical protein VM537_10095 [Anaerolineae bacterium]|nr:hypothetical protein [Anaerolineae bacterium]
MSELIVLRNRHRHKPFQFTIFHSVVCKAEGKCFCGKQAKMGIDERGESVRAESSVFILPRGQSGPLPASVLRIPQVACAMTKMGFIEQADAFSEVEVFAAPPAVIPAPPALPAPPAAPPAPKAVAQPAPTRPKPAATAPPTFTTASTHRVTAAKVGPRGR